MCHWRRHCAQKKSMAVQSNGTSVYRNVDLLISTDLPLGTARFFRKEILSSTSIERVFSSQNRLIRGTRQDAKAKQEFLPKSLETQKGHSQSRVAAGAWGRYGRRIEPEQLELIFSTNCDDTSGNNGPRRQAFRHSERPEASTYVPEGPLGYYR
jgi:hypothetical protein